MSEFKFACPVCGQHITCDSAASGTQMNCPTCFRKLVVPQAPKSERGAFVLRATEAQSRTVPLPGQSQTVTQPRSQTKLPVIAGIVIAVLVLGSVAFNFRDKLFSAAKVSDSKNSATNSITIAQTASTNWTLNLSRAEIPNAPAEGMIMGRRFSLERAVIQGGRLDLRQGPKWPPDVGLSIHLYADRSEDLAGKTVVLEASRTNAPRVVLRWKDEQSNAVTKDFRKGYAARVEFGSVTNKRLAGKIFLATPDDAKSYVAGTFSAEIRKPNPPKP